MKYAGGENFLFFQQVLCFSPLLWLRPFPFLAILDSLPLFQFLSSMSQTQKATSNEFPHPLILYPTQVAFTLYFVFVHYLCINYPHNWSVAFGGTGTRSQILGFLESMENIPNVVDIPLLLFKENPLFLTILSNVSSRMASILCALSSKLCPLCLEWCLKE